MLLLLLLTLLIILPLLLCKPGLQHFISYLEYGIFGNLLTSFIPFTSGNVRYLPSNKPSRSFRTNGITKISSLIYPSSISWARNPSVIRFKYRSCGIPTTHCVSVSSINDTELLELADEECDVRRLHLEEPPIPPPSSASSGENMNVTARIAFGSSVP